MEIREETAEDIPEIFKVNEAAFMALELEEVALEDLSGVARYHPAFDGV